MGSEAIIKDLQDQITKLKQELETERSKNDSSLPARGKILTMSSEVVDSNPYR